MPSRKPERRMASSSWRTVCGRAVFALVDPILPHFGKRSVRFQRDGSERLRDPGVEIHFSASFFALFFANTGKFCTGEHQTGAFNHRAVDHLAVKETTPRPSRAAASAASTTRRAWATSLRVGA